jgi:hypothetical protein
MVDGAKLVVERKPGVFGAHYDVKQVVIGPQARAADVLAHAELIRLVERYNGLVGKLRLVWDRLHGTVGTEFEGIKYSHGSRGWVLAHEIDKIGQHIASTMILRDNGQVDAARANAEIALLADRSLGSETRLGPDSVASRARCSCPLERSAAARLASRKRAHYSRRGRLVQ